MVWCVVGAAGHHRAATGGPAGRDPPEVAAREDYQEGGVRGDDETVCHHRAGAEVLQLLY